MPEQPPALEPPDNFFQAGVERDRWRDRARLYRHPLRRRHVGPRAPGRAVPAQGAPKRDRPRAKTPMNRRKSALRRRATPFCNSNFHSRLRAVCPSEGRRHGVRAGRGRRGRSWRTGRPTRTAPAASPSSTATLRTEARQTRPGLFAGGGEILRLARPASRSSGFRMRGPSGPAPAAGPDHRLWETAVLFHLRDAFRAGDVWLVRSRRLRRHPKGAAVGSRRRLRPVRTTGSPSAGSLWTRGAGRCGRWRKHRRQRAPRREDGNRRAGRGR